MENDINNSMLFICLGSGSSGNAYIFKKDDELILVESGFDFKTLTMKMMKQGILPTDINKVVITHKHKDHSQSVLNWLELGKDVYAPQSCFEDIGYIKGNAHIVEDGSKFTLSSKVKAIAFSVVHDVESYGYIFFDAETKESTLFINDTRYFDFKYKDYVFDYIFIECNHIRKRLEAMMQTSLEKGEEGKVFKFKRQASFHLSLASCKKFLKELKHINKTKAIFLMHLSSEVCNDMVVKNEIAGVFNKPTSVCYKEGGIN